MSKEPARRYASARELAEDVTRHLTGMPVLAREPSFRYLAVKLARRHRAAFLSAAVALLALVAALGVSLWQMRVAMRERNRATERFNDVRQLASALIFKIHDGVQPLAGSTPVRQQIVSEALTYLERLSRDPASDDGLRLELARGYLRIGDVQGQPASANLGDSEGALRSYRKGAELLRPLVAGGAPEREIALELGALDLALAVLATTSAARGEAILAAREAQSVAESLLRRDPNDPEATSLLGNAHFHLAHRPGPRRVASRMAEGGRDLRALAGQATRRPQAPAQRRPSAEVPRGLLRAAERLRAGARPSPAGKGTG